MLTSFTDIITETVCRGEDVAISFEHHVANLDWEHFLELRAAAVGNEDIAELVEGPVPSDDPVERFARTCLAAG